MPLQLPNLDDRSYADLVDDARRQIPAHDPQWTNHNPSDPGITLIELFAYLTEILLYRLNRVTDANQRNFLKLLGGDASDPDLASATRASVNALRSRFRAVTAVDFEELALNEFNQWLAARKFDEASGRSLNEWWEITRAERDVPANLPSRVPKVGRTRCLPNRNLERGSAEESLEAAPGHVSLVIVPEDRAEPQPSTLMRDALWGFLDERRTVATRHHVVGPSYAPVHAEIVIARTSDAVSDTLEAQVRGRLSAFLDPLTWPFGRDIYVSEIAEQLEGLLGVDHVTDLRLFSQCAGGAPRCVEAAPTWHPEGDQIGLRLGPDHLPSAALERFRFVIAPQASFVEVRVHVTLPTTTSDPASLKRDLRNAVRTFFHPLYGTPAELNADLAGEDFRFSHEFRLSALTAALTPAFGAIPLRLEAAERRTRRDAQTVVSVGINAEVKPGVPGYTGEVINWRIVFDQ